MVPHSFAQHLKSATVVFAISAFSFPALCHAWITGACAEDPGAADVLRFDLNPNIWASNSSLTSQRGIYLWVGGQKWNVDQNPVPVPFPILAVLSTLSNGTYISTSPSGSQDAPCPNSYFSYGSDDTQTEGSDNDYTFNASMTCHGYYDLTSSQPIYFESSSNFTGSPEDAATTMEITAADVKYGITSLNLVLPQTITQPAFPGTSGTGITFHGTGNYLFGFVDQHEKQAVGLGLNSTLLNDLYAGGFISSRAVGLYYGVPEAAGPSLARNGSLVMGGYATNRLLGNFSAQTYPLGRWSLPRQCPWEVDVAKVSSGSEVSSLAFTACIEPSELSLVLPAALYSQFSTTGESNLTITLTNGLEVTIPSSLISVRAVDDADQSPILGAPFLSQVYLLADYQERTLSTGLADSTQALPTGSDTLQCIQHPNTTGNIGWAVGSPAGSGASGTNSASSPDTTGKKSIAAGRASVEMGFVMFLAVVLGLSSR